MGYPWAGIGLVLILFAAAAAALSWVQRSRLANPEVVRKLLHLFMGLVVLGFPWLFETIWPVLLLAALFTFGLTALRASPSLKRRFGSIIHGVGRSSLGEIFFPLSAALLFVLSFGDAILFCVPMLVLSLADSAAALVGRSYGRLAYSFASTTKSVEGSVAFFTVAFLSAHLSLLLFTDTGRAESLLISLSLSLFLTVIEAASARGLDNLFLPIAAFLLLKTYRELELSALAAHLAISAFAAVLFACSLRPSFLKRKTFVSFGDHLRRLISGHARASHDRVL